jgi:hypothetical protein
MLFFQTALLLGYAFAYAATRPLPLPVQAVLQIVIVVAACLMLPITPSPALKPIDAADPIWRILRLLTLSVGAPYVVLATTSPLLQRWLSEIDPGILASRFFALSNFGSFVGLLSYPFVVEPLLPSLDQTRLWSAAFYGYAALMTACAVIVLTAHKRPRAEGGGAVAGLSPTTSAAATGWWLVYSALGSVLLLATTNQITQWSAVIPFLWVAPLSAYLLTFVLCFGLQTGRARAPMLLAFVAAAALSRSLPQPEAATDVLIQVGLQCAALFFGCMLCHGEIVRLQPPPRALPKFYLMIALGGAVGGAFVTLLAPVLFSDYWEAPLAVAVTALLFLIHEFKVALRLTRSRASGPGQRAVTLASAALLLLAALGTVRGLKADAAVTVDRVRNFYGVVKVYVDSKDDAANAAFVMQQAGVDQGSQFQAPDRRSEIFCAYDRDHALGLAFRDNRRRREKGPAAPLKIGLIGEGVGMAAGLAKTGDTLRYYELNPAVIALANRYFSFIADSPARVDIVAGDGRLSLEREAQAGQLGQFDIIVVDAFRGAAPPMHLMTREAFELYRRHLAPGGILAVNFELETFELSPLHRGLAAALDLGVHWFETQETDQCEGSISWALYTSDTAFWKVPEVAAAISPWRDGSDRRLLWTDGSSNLLSVINWQGSD